MEFNLTLDALRTITIADQFGFVLTLFSVCGYVTFIRFLGRPVNNFAEASRRDAAQYQVAKVRKVR